MNSTYNQFELEGLDLDEIISIEEMGMCDTIDIEVEDTHMFYANDIYTHNSGFDAEIVDASQSGGSIKRLQKAHLFMSIAKTPDQKEASLATIKIIKARFAQDGQIFRDCIFNNDTMEIVIRDSGYVGGNYTNKTKYGDLVAAQYGTAPSASIHGVISSVLPTEPEVDADMDKMRQAYIENFNIETKKTENDGVKPNTETDNTVITRYFTDPNTVINNTESPHLTGTDINHPNNKYVTLTTVNEAIDNGLFEIEDKPIEKSVGLPPLSGIVNYIEPKRESFEWTGETYTTATIEVEVKHEDIPVVDEEPPMIVRYFDITPPEVPVQPEVSVAEIVPKTQQKAIRIFYGDDGIVKTSVVDFSPVVPKVEEILEKEWRVVDGKMNPEHEKFVKEQSIINETLISSPEEVPKPPITVIQKPRNIVELEKRLVDEDDIPSHDRTVFDMLRNMSKSQNVVKRE